MSREPFEDVPLDSPEASPSPEVRERVLRSCRRAMAERRTAERRQQVRWRWGVAVGVALLLLNGLVEQRSAQRIAGLMAGNSRAGTRVAGGPVPSDGRRMIGSLRARATLLSVLLRDPDAL